MNQIRGFGRARIAAGLLVAAVACGAREEAPDNRGASAPPAPPVTAVTSAQPASTRAGQPRVVVLGDSLTAGLGLAVGEAYPALLQQRLDEAGLKFRVINAGKSGDTSAGGLARLDWTLDGDVRILIVALGGNDALRALPPEELKHNLAQIVERAQARGVAVILAGMEAPTNWGSVYTKAFHDVYPSLAKQYSVPLVPFLLEGVAGIEALNQRDGIHPTAEGDRIIADTIWPVLRPVAQREAARGRGATGS